MKPEQELSLYDYWNIIYKHRLFIICFTFIACFVALIYSLLIPKIYTATTVVLPPESEKSGKMSFLGSSFFSSALPDLMGGDYNTNIVLAMLKSRRMAEDVVKKFDLINVYKSRTIGETIELLQKSTSIFLTKEKAISLSVETISSQLSADITNYYITNLDAINSELQISSAKPVVRILDKASPPEKESKPRILHNVLFVFVISFILLSSMVIVKNYILKQ